MLRYQLSNGKDQVAWHRHDGMVLPLKSCFVVRYCLFLRLPLLVLQNALQSALTPILRHILLISHILLRLRPLCP